MIIRDGYIIATEKTDSNHNEVLEKIQNKPENPEGYQYRLRADNLEWEMVELPEAEPFDENADISDYKNALSDLGVQFHD